MGQITVMTGPERRRQWRDEERLQILAEAFAPGACVADVARRRRAIPQAEKQECRRVAATAASSTPAAPPPPLQNPLVHQSLSATTRPISD